MKLKKNFSYSKLLAITTAFVMFGNITMSSALEVVDVINNELGQEEVIEVEELEEDIEKNNKDKDDVGLEKEDSVEVKPIQNDMDNESKINDKVIKKEEHKKDNINVKNYNDVSFEIIKNDNPNIQLNTRDIVARDCQSDSYDEILGIIKNTGSKTYSFDIVGKFYKKEDQSKYSEKTYEVKNLKPNETDYFLLEQMQYTYTNLGKVEFYIENVREIYNNNDESKIDLKVVKTEYKTDNNGKKRETIVTADVTNNSDNLIEKLGIKVTQLNSSGKPIAIMENKTYSDYYDLKNIGVGETKRVEIKTDDIYEDQYSSNKINITEYTKNNYEIKNIKLSKNSPQYINKEVKITTELESDNYWYDEYKYSIYDGTSWSVIRNWSQDETATWKPTKSGDYKIKVEVRNSDSSKIEVRKVINYKVVDPNLGNLNVNLNKTSPQVAGTAVNIAASSTGSNTEYKFEIKKGSSVVAKKDYSKTSTYKWMPKSEGSYTIDVYSRNASYKDLYNKKSVTFKVTKPSYSIRSLTVDKKSPQPTESNLKLTANTTGSNLLYKFSYYDGKSWKTIKDYSSSKTVTWKPKISGKLKLKVDIKVRDTDYKTSKTISYEIFKKGTVKINSLKASKKSPQPQNASIKLTTNAVGSNLEYKYSVYNGKKWKTVRKYSSSNTYTWKPSSPYKNYKIKVDVRSKGKSKVYSKEIKYNIFKKSKVSVTSLKSSKTSKVVQYSNVSISAKGKGSYLEYRFKSYDPVSKKWYLENDFSSSSSFTFYTYSPGTNKIKVEVRQRGCTQIASKTISLKVHQSPSISVSGRYNYYWKGNNKYLNYGYMDIQNYGNKTVKIKKFEMITNGDVVYKYSPKSLKVNPYGYSTLWFYSYDNEKTYSPLINSGTHWKLTYEYDGLTHTYFIY